MHPWIMLVHGQVLSMDNSYPWRTLIHGGLLSMDTVYPWVTLAMGNYGDSIYVPSHIA